MTHADTDSSGDPARITKVTFDPDPAVVFGQTACPFQAPFRSLPSAAAPLAAAAAAAAPPPPPAAAAKSHQQPTRDQAFISVAAGPHAAAALPPLIACRPFRASFSSKSGSENSSSSNALTWLTSAFGAYIGSQTAKVEPKCERRGSKYEARRERKLARRGGLYHAFRE